LPSSSLSVTSWADVIICHEDYRGSRDAAKSDRLLGHRYNRHPDLDVVDIGSVGLWGEWHMSQTKMVDNGKPVPLPTLRTRLAIIDAWRQAFPDQTKVMLIGDIEGMRHAVAQGCGWRADCLGDLGGFSPTWNHMCDCYPQNLEKAGASSAWQNAPVAFESCWDMRRWKKEGWDIRYIFDYALDDHASYLNNKSAPLPEGVRPEIERFLRRLGYRLVLRKLEHDQTVRPGGAVLGMRMVWDNVGVAPPYRDYCLAFRLTPVDRDAQSPTIHVSKTSIRDWLPGPRSVTVEVPVPALLPTGRYDLALAIVDPVSPAPAIRLAIAGRDPAGWYPLSQISVCTEL